MTDTPIEAKNSGATLISWVIVFGIGYAVLRYHLAGPVPWKDLAFFTLNKGVCLSAFILLVLNFALGPARNLGIKVSEGWLNARMAIGITGFLLAFVHVLMSVMLFSPAVYGKFFDTQSTMTLNAGLSMFAGVIAFIVLWGYNLSFKTTMHEDKAFIAFITSRQFLLWAMLLGAAHLFFMGYSGWLKPSDWHGGLPPISLVAFTTFVVGYIINLMGRE